MEGRKHWIDNLRNLSILFLFPYHTCMIWVTFDNFYVHVGGSRLADGFVWINWAWLMPLLFVLAGMSAFYALRRRSGKMFLLERAEKLLVPLLAGVLLLVPVQSYIADRFHNGFSGGYLEYLPTFFTRWTDLTGYDGGFTPGQLWFLLYLLLISLLALPLMLLFLRKNWGDKAGKLPLPVLLLGFLPCWLLNPVLNIGGKSLGSYFALFLLGFCLLTNEELMERVQRRKWVWLGLAVAALAVQFLLDSTVGSESGFTFKAMAMGLLSQFTTWACILALLALGRAFLNFTNRPLSRLAALSFPIYVFHQSWLVAVAYFAVAFLPSAWIQFPVILFGSFLLTLPTCLFVERIPGLRRLFGMKAPKKALPGKAAG